MIKYKRWQKTKCLNCGNKWLEIWAMVWFENGKECSTPVLVCPKTSCAMFYDPDEYGLTDDDLRAS